MSARRSASLIELLSAIVSRASPADWIMSLPGRLISGALKRENELLCKLRFRACGPDGLMRRRVLVTIVWVPCARLTVDRAAYDFKSKCAAKTHKFSPVHPPPLTSRSSEPSGPAVRKIDPRATNESSSQTQDEMSNDFNTQNTTRCETPSLGQIIWQPIPSTDPPPTCE
jgi:hypothetical protein